MTSLSSGLNASLSGLKNYAYRVSVGASNIAKSDSVAGKETEVFMLGSNSFSSTGSYTPSGITSTVQQYITTVGDPKPAQVNTFMTIGGQGFFVVNNSATPSLGQTGFTRVGTFEPDKNGDFKNTAGQYLMVWPTDSGGKVTARDVSSTDGLVIASTKNLTGAPFPSSNITMNMILPSSQAVGTPYQVTTNVIDSLGVNHQVTFTWNKTNANPQQWTVTAASPEAGGISAPYNGGMTVQFDQNGNLSQVNGGTNPPPQLTINWNSAAAPSVLTLSMGTIGNSDGVRCIGQTLNTTGVKADGRSAGNLENVFIEDSTGLIFAKYDNESQVPFAKIPLALFDYANGLLESMGGCYTMSKDSGSCRLSNSGQNGSGIILSSSTEESSIDSTEQFTRIIVDQTNYQSNAKALSIIHEMQKATTQMI